MKTHIQHTAIVWHELTHVSQVRRMIAEKGLFWASDYWSANVYQQANNSLNSGSAYGSRGEDNWQIIALSEGWANFREQHLARNIIKLPLYVATSNRFLIPYVEMFIRLEAIGCSFKNLEKSLSTYSLNGFNDNLAKLHPELSYNISLIIADYD